MEKNTLMLYVGDLDGIDLLTKEEAGELLFAIRAHAKGEDVGGLSPIVAMSFTYIAASMDRSAKKYEEMCNRRREAGRKGGIARAKQSQALSSIAKHCQAKPSHTDTDTDTVSDTDTDINNIYSPSGDPAGMPLTRAVIDYLNSVSGRHFRPVSSAHRLISARVRDGFYTLDDFKKVIDNKWADWGNDEHMRQYMRPETLFCASHFESYLNQNREADPRPDDSERWGDFTDLLKEA